MVFCAALCHEVREREYINLVIFLFFGSPGSGCVISLSCLRALQCCLQQVFVLLVLRWLHVDYSDGLDYSNFVPKIDI